jgi:hypothetical protein
LGGRKFVKFNITININKTKTMKFIVILSFVLVFSSCSSNKSDTNDQKGFFTYMIKVAVDGDNQEWFQCLIRRIQGEDQAG